MALLDNLVLTSKEANEKNEENDLITYENWFAVMKENEQRDTN